MQKILVADDDPNVREVIRFALSKAGYAVVLADNGAIALSQFAREQPALLVLDILMPEMDGLEVCRRLRAEPRSAATPILFVSSRDDEVDKIIGLEMGGDDYLAKPFSPRELVARVKAILRRSSAPRVAAPLQVHGRLSLSSEHYQAFWDNQELVLTLTEFGLLRTLLARPGKVCSRDHLMNESYELHKIVSDRTIDSHVRRLRQKFAALGVEPIETLHGVGYRLGSCT
ncbi:response regulator transcription factor [Stenotrophobium rhamnosiphilum]|uniref:Two-component system response regulator CreB n=1 Tax=Stenotrophobium rhamnosiphilum TaxID=2029166 RepID=A0A2T5MGF4_9GAMM|nr:response regulator transcription factor [Stenotrophobium rhamnosiphilum]PTU31657.1 two-component system response regulator CreB [Stenotrophobium rhamnosiphilum]